MMFVFVYVTARHYMRQVVEGLLYLHSHGILHRDLTLANLLLTNDMEVVSSFCQSANGEKVSLRLPDMSAFFLGGGVFFKFYTLFFSGEIYRIFRM